MGKKGYAFMASLCQEPYVTDQLASTADSRPSILWREDHQIRFECVCTTTWQNLYVWPVLHQVKKVVRKHFQLPQAQATNRPPPAIKVYAISSSTSNDYSTDEVTFVNLSSDWASVSMASGWHTFMTGSVRVRLGTSGDKQHG